MAATELAFHYLIVVLGLTVVSYFAYGYFQNMKEYLEILQSVALRIVPTCGNPLAVARVTLLVPLYNLLTFRVLKRFFINHGFKLVFMFAFSMYTWNVWNESLSDDPFTIVGVSPSATAKQIRKACRKESLRLHPDKHPGQEDAIRPQFEKLSRACKVLNDPKSKDKYVKWGVLPKVGETGGEVVASTGSSILQVGGGSYLLSMSFYFLLFVGFPSILAFNFADMLYDEEAMLAKLAGDTKTLSDEMTALYSYGHFSGMFLDCAELYIATAQVELLEIKNMVSKLNPPGGKKVDSLLNHHHSRFALWKGSNGVEDKDKADFEAKCKKIDEAIKLSVTSVGGLEKKGSRKNK